MRKFLPYILIGIMVIVGIFGPAGVKTSYAISPCGVGVGMGECMKSIAAWVANMMLTLVSKLVAIAGYLLDAAIDYSITNAGKGSLAVVEIGWTLSRDVANLFFIFILLYIAIATILRVSGYGMKELLARIIVIALLVNFSLVITKVIIDSSNVLASEFYSKIKNIKDTSGKTHLLSEALVAGLTPQRLFGVETSEGEIKLEGGKESTLMQIFIIGSLGAVLLLVVAFVLFAAAILFVIRTAILWLLMILAPLAFLFMVLPKTKQYANQWWDKLFNQSFFAPAYLFLLYIVINIISKGAILEQLKADNQSFGTAFGSPNDANVKLILNFVILIVLLIASLIMAQKMGAWGAGTVMGWGKDLRKAATGYAGRVGKRYTGRAMAAAEKGLEGEGRVAGVLKKVPFLQRGLAAGAQLKRKEIGAYEKQYAGYDTKTLEQLKDKLGTTREARAAMEKIIARKGSEKAKEENIKRENERYEKIERELPKMKEFNEADKQRKIELEVELKSNELKMAQNPSDEGLQKKRIQLIIEREQVEGRIKEVDQMETEKQKIEENRERRRELGSLEERVVKAEAAAEEKAKKPAAEKPKETKT